MKNRKSILLVVLLLAVGFAAVSTTLYINGSTNINPNQDDFNVYYSDAYVNGVQDKSVITDDTHISFTTELSTLGEKYVLDYEVANGSKNYDAELIMTCTSSNDYLNITNDFDDETILEARNTRNGTLTLELKKSNAGEDVDVIITCTISANAIERTSLNNSDIQTASDYIIEGYYMDENNNALANKNLVIFSDTPHYVTTDNDGYLFYNGLEHGNHEVYYVNDSLDKIKKMAKDEIIENATSSATFTTTTEDNIVFNNNTLITNFNIKESDVYCESLINREWTFSYTGTEQKFLTRCVGDYKVELWGAQGGNSGNYKGGDGAYTRGNIILNANLETFINVGGYSNTISGGYNGGGKASSGGSGRNIYTGGGGGSTDIRVNSTSILDRIMVAAGGGGAIDFSNGTYGSGAIAGGLISGLPTHYWPNIPYSMAPYATTQVSSGYIEFNGKAACAGSFYYGGNGNGYCGDNCTYSGGGGGSGYYGGGSGCDYSYGGVGGSSFISGHLGCDAISSDSTESNIIHTGQANHYSGYIFTDTIMVDGAGYNWTTSKGSYTGMPNHAGTSTMTGNTGNGYAKITYLGTN